MATQTAAEKAAAARLAEREQLRTEHPDAWVPVSEGDTLMGAVTDVQDAWSDTRGEGGGWYPLLTIRVEEADGYEAGAEIKVHCFAAVLYNEIMRRQPKVGETMRITYGGTRPPKVKGHSPTRIYTVKIKGRVNEGADAYARIASSQPASTVGPRQPAQPAASGSDVPADTSDFDGSANGAAKDEEDIPF